MKKLFLILCLLISQLSFGQHIGIHSSNERGLFFIDSTGSDTNDGKTASTPVKTLSALQTKVLAYGRLARVRFLKGTSYAGELALSSINNIFIDQNYAKVNLADTVTGTWTQPDATNYPNVWQITWSVSTGTINEQCPMIVNGAMPTFVQTVANCNSTSNSYGVTVADLADGSPVTVFVNTGTNPNSDGKVYEIMKRNGIVVGDSCYVKNSFSQTQVNNNGSFQTGKNATTINSLFGFGAKHNTYVKNGIYNDCISYDAEGENLSASMGPFVGNDNGDVSSYNATFTRCGVIYPAARTLLNSGFYTHGGSNSPFNSVTLDQCFFYHGQYIGSPSATTFTCQNSYIETDGGGGSDGAATTFIFQRNIFRPIGTSAGFGSIAHGTTIKNNAFYFAATNTITAFSVISTMTAFTLEYNTFAGSSVAPMYYTTALSHNTATITCDHNIYAFQPNLRYHIWVDSFQTYVGDYNIFYANSNQVNNKYHGAVYTTLSSWQTATGQDAHSVYVTTSQLSNLFLGTTSAGDFRINPSASVTWADGTTHTGIFSDGTAITAAGVQEHWDFNNRKIVSGPPTTFPTIPLTYANCITYLKNPSAWSF